MILRLLTLLIIGVLIVFAFRFISQLQQVNPKAQGAYFPLGVFMTAGFVDQIDVKVNDLKAHNFDSIIFNNTGLDRADSILTVTDQMNFNAVAAFDYDLWRSWWPDTVATTIDNARSAIYPLVDRVKNHPSLKGYNLIDEPNLSMKDKVALAVQAFRERDSIHPAMPVLIDDNIIPTLFDYSKPDVMLLDVYPVSYNSAPCDLRINGGEDMVTYIRRAVITRPADKPLWFILQAHSFGDGTQDWHLRTPSPTEARMEQWLALGEGGTGFFWFIYDWDQGGDLLGSPALYTEVADLARRVGPLRTNLLSSHKVDDKVTVAGSNAGAYASTLINNDGKYYVIAVNRSCQNQSLTLQSSSLTGQLKDIETNQTFAFNTPVDFRAGDGRMFELVSLSIPIPTPTPTPTPISTTVPIVPSPSPIPTPIASGNGLNATYYNGMNFANLFLSRTDLNINFDWGYGSPAVSVPIDQFSVKWTGYIIPPASGNYTFYARTDDGVRVWVNNVRIINYWRDQPATERKKSIYLTGGRKYPFKMEYYENTGNAIAQLLWSGPGIQKQIIPSGVFYLR